MAAASLSYAFIVHVNPEEAAIGDGWWIKEESWPRVDANRGMIESKIWSPAGKHIASAYQDGIVVPRHPKRGVEKL
jgi:acyl-CoA thioesterase